MDTNTKLKAAVELKGIRAVTLRFGHAVQGGLVECIRYWGGLVAVYPTQNLRRSKLGLVAVYPREGWSHCIGQWPKFRRKYTRSRGKFSAAPIYRVGHLWAPSAGPGWQWRLSHDQTSQDYED